MAVGLIITAAGSSQRFGKNKLLEPLNNNPLIVKTCLGFKGFEFHQRVLSVPQAEFETWATLVKTHALPFTCVAGGPTRAESVKNAVEACKNCEKLLIHDGARPFVSQTLIVRILEALNTHTAAIPALPVSDTIKQVQNNSVISTLNRNELVAVQTPQGFHTGTLLNAYTNITELKNYTDEASIVEANQTPVWVVEGDPDNIKITYPKDLK